MSAVHSSPTQMDILKTRQKMHIVDVAFEKQETTVHISRACGVTVQFVGSVCEYLVVE